MTKSNITFIIIICLFIFSCKHVQNKQIAIIKTGNFKGQIKTLQTLNYSTVLSPEGFKKDKLLAKEYITYDSIANEIERLSYDEKYSIILQTINKYDLKGNKLETADYDKRTNTFLKSILVYDNKNNKT